MAYDQQLIAAKLRRWEKYLLQFRLPEWREIPDIGLYMEQVVAVLKQYLDYLPPELKEEQIITSATINNYVRTRIMPEPKKKRYYRVHIAYLIIICTLKQSLSIAMIQHVIPTGLDEEQVRRLYESYRERHSQACEYFVQQVKLLAAVILEHPVDSPLAAADTMELIQTSAVVGGFAKLFAEKLLLLDNKTLSDGGDITLHREGESIPKNESAG